MTNLNFEEIVKIINLNCSGDDDLCVFFRNNIDLETLNKFSKRGINDPAIIINILNKSKTDEKIKEVIQNFDIVDNEHFLLLQWLNSNLLEKVCMNDTLDNYLCDNPYVLQEILGGVQTLEDYNFFEKVISLKEVQENPHILEGLDHQQIKIYNTFNNSQISENVIIDNVKKNLQLFENMPELIKRLPLMLDSENNKKTVDLLVSSGLDLNQLDNLDGTIFCIPYDIICTVNNHFVSNNMSLIVNNDCCPEFYSIIEKIRRKQENNNKIPPLPIRHRRKQIGDNNDQSEQKKSRA